MKDLGSKCLGSHWQKEAEPGNLVVKRADQDGMNMMNKKEDNSASTANIKS